MIIRLRLEVTDEQRRAIAYRYGKLRLASRKEVLSELTTLWDTHLEDLDGDLAQWDEEQEEARMLESEEE